MTIICTEEERREMELLIAIAHDCLCSPNYSHNPECNRCIKNRIEWTIKTDSGEFNAHETVIGKALDAGHIYR